MLKFVLYILGFFVLNSAFGASYSYWLNGWRKATSAEVEDILVVETPSYIFSLDTQDLSYSYFYPQKKEFKYGSYGLDLDDITKLKKAPLELSIKVGQDKYVANLSKAGKFENTRALQDVLLWESGRHCHHYDFKDLEFLSAKGDVLDIYADLKLVAWENHLALSLNAKNIESPKEGVVEGVIGTGRCVENEKITVPASDIETKEDFSASIWVKLPTNFVQASNKNGIIFLKDRNMSVDGSWGIKVEDIYCYSAFMKAGDICETNIFKAGEDCWNLLVMTYADNKLKFYANGKLIGKSEVKNALPLKPADITLGGRGDKSGGVYSMCIDEFKIWNKALSDADIKDLYKNPSQKIASENLVFEKNFDVENYENPKAKELKNLSMEISLGANKVSKAIKGTWENGVEESLTLPVFIKKLDDAKLKVSKDGVDYPVEFDEQKLCYVASVSKLNRESGFANSCNYDDFNLSVNSNSKVPFLLHMKNVASITGLCPILCYKDGSPTGIQVQLSKNWHERKIGAYLMAYVEVPKGEYILRIAYGFYGKYPSASHANLSLVGYGGSGRWEQLAIGAWGETICFDADNSLVTNWITDIRMLMARDGKDGKMWGWTDAGWGGDWLNIKTENQTRLMPVGLKTTYLSQGPCLTDVRYEGYLGRDREMSMFSQIQTLRTNDYARTFQRVKYTFNKDVKAKEFSIYNLRNLSKHIVLGNKKGLVGEYEVEAGSGLREFDFGNGLMPLWFAALGRVQNRIKAVGYKAIAIRDFEAKVGGKTYKAPVVSYDEKAKAMNLILPDNISRFRKGDSIFFDIELFTLHARASDYYGDDEVYRKHLEENLLSYKTAQREALGNNLKLKVSGGKLLRNYPIEILATDKSVELEIEGGVGLVPLKVSNLTGRNLVLYEVLDNGKLEKLDQSVLGNDFYQLEYNEYTKTYTLTYNLPLNEKKTKWILR